MSNILQKNYSADGFDNDTVYPLRFRTAYFSGSDPTFLVPSSPTFPDTRAGTPSRYIYFFPGQIYNENFITYPVSIRDITNSVTLNRVTSSPANNEFRIVINTASNAKTMIEFNVAQAGVEIAYDLYLYSGSLCEDENNYLNVKNLNVDNLIVDNIEPSFILLQDQKTLSTDGGTATSGAWYPRDINTEVYDNNDHCSFIQSLNYDNEAGTFTEGLVITGATSSATATIHTLVDNGTSGTLYLTNVSGTFQNNEQITDSSTGDALVDGTIMDKAFLLDVGTYKINASSTFYKTNQSRIRLYDITSDTALAESHSGFTGAGDATESKLDINYIFTLSSQSVLEIQYRVTSSTAVAGLGVSSNFGTNEIYTQIELQKLS